MTDLVLKTVKLRLTGLTEILLHNPQSLNPLLKISKEIKLISGKRKKTDSDLEELARLEFMSGLYLNEKHQVIIPSEIIEAMFIGGAKKTKNGPSAKCGIFIEENPILIFEDSDKNPDYLWGKGYYLQCPVRIGNSKVIRTRPKFDNWSLEFTVKYHSEILSEKDIEQFAIDAGIQIGIGDWRPKYGRFTVEKLN